MCFLIASSTPPRNRTAYKIVRTDRDSTMFYGNCSYVDGATVKASRPTGTRYVKKIDQYSEAGIYVYLNKPTPEQIRKLWKGQMVITLRVNPKDFIARGRLEIDFTDSTDIVPVATYRKATVIGEFK